MRLRAPVVCYPLPYTMLNTNQSINECSYLFRAFNISMVTNTDNAIVIGCKSLNTSQVKPSKADGVVEHCM